MNATCTNLLLGADDSPRRTCGVSAVPSDPPRCPACLMLDEPWQAASYHDGHEAGRKLISTEPITVELLNAMIAEADLLVSQIETAGHPAMRTRGYLQALTVARGELS